MNSINSFGHVSFLIDYLMNNISEAFIHLVFVDKIEFFLKGRMEVFSPVFFLGNDEVFAQNQVQFQRLFDDMAWFK